MSRAAFVFVILSLALASVRVGAQPAQETINGDPQAWRDVLDAYQRLDSLKTYRISKTGTPEPPGVSSLAAALGREPHRVEVVKPDRFRVNSSMGPEYVVVGSSVSARMLSAGVRTPWLCLPSTWVMRERISGGGETEFPMGLFLTVAFAGFQPLEPQLLGLVRGPLASLRRRVTITRQPDENVGGSPTRVYEYRVILTAEQGAETRMWERLYIIEQGVPRRTQILVPRATFDYSDYDAAITIEMPRCQ